MHIFGIPRVHRVLPCIWFPWAPPVLTLDFVERRRGLSPKEGSPFVIKPMRTAIKSALPPLQRRRPIPSAKWPHSLTCHQWPSFTRSHAPPRASPSSSEWELVRPLLKRDLSFQPRMNPRRKSTTVNAPATFASPCSAASRLEWTHCAFLPSFLPSFLSSAGRGISSSDQTAAAAASFDSATASRRSEARSSEEAPQTGWRGGREENGEEKAPRRELV